RQRCEEETQVDTRVGQFAQFGHAVPPEGQIPPTKRPGARVRRGSNWSLTRRMSGRPGTGPQTSTPARMRDGALSTTQEPPRAIRVVRTAPSSAATRAGLRVPGSAAYTTPAPTEPRTGTGEPAAS